MHLKPGNKYIFYKSYSASMDKAPVYVKQGN